MSPATQPPREPAGMKRHVLCSTVRVYQADGREAGPPDYMRSLFGAIKTQAFPAKSKNNQITRPCTPQT